MRQILLLYACVPHRPRLLAVYFLIYEQFVCVPFPSFFISRLHNYIYFCYESKFFDRKGNARDRNREKHFFVRHTTSHHFFLLRMIPSSWDFEIWTMTAEAVVIVGAQTEKGTNQEYIYVCELLGRTKTNENHHITQKHLSISHDVKWFHLF